MVNPSASTFMKRRTVRPDGAAKGPRLRGQSHKRPAAWLNPGAYGQALAPPQLPKQIQWWAVTFSQNRGETLLPFRHGFSVLRADLTLARKARIYENLLDL